MTDASDWSQISVPLELPEVKDEITYQRVVMNSGATWDYFPGHFDPAYAESQGHPTIFVNTMHLADRLGRAGQPRGAPEDEADRFDLRRRHDGGPRTRRR
jgi:acyl dehydratase